MGEKHAVGAVVQLHPENESDKNALAPRGEVSSDGLVRYIPQTISLCKLAALVTRAGGEVIDSSSF